MLKQFHDSIEKEPNQDEYGSRIKKDLNIFIECKQQEMKMNTRQEINLFLFWTINQMKVFPKDMINLILEYVSEISYLELLETIEDCKRFYKLNGLGDFLEAKNKYEADLGAMMVSYKIKIHMSRFIEQWAYNKNKYIYEEVIKNPLSNFEIRVKGGTYKRVQALYDFLINKRVPLTDKLHRFYNFKRQTYSEVFLLKTTNRSVLIIQSIRNSLEC